MSAPVREAMPGVYEMTYRDWLALPEDGRSYELIGSELHLAPPPSIEHQRISRDLEYILITYLRRSGRGEVLDAPVGVRLSDQDVLEPDLLVVLTENAHLIEAQVVNGPPDLVVEILSPGTAKRDLGSKRRLYAASGVPEYWIVDPMARAIDVLVNEGGELARHGLFRGSEALRSALLPDLEIPLSEVFGD